MSLNTDYYTDLLEKCHSGDINALNDYINMSSKIMEGDNIFDDDVINKITDLADRKNSYAVNLLGMIYEKSFYKSCDIRKAIGLYKKAINLGNSDAMCNLAYLYRYGIDFVKKDISKAIDLYRKAVDIGNPRAMMSLAHLYETSDVPDYDKAVGLYEKLVALGDHNAMCRLAHMYILARGVNKDDKIAIELFEKAVGLGNVDAMVGLASIYKNGNNKDLFKALGLCILAKNKKECLSVLDNIMNSDIVDGLESRDYDKVMEKFVNIFSDPFIVSIYDDMPDSLKNMKNIIDFYNKEVAITEEMLECF